MTKMHSSGEQRQFSTGAVRDAASKKPMPHLISPYALMRLGEWLRFACQDRKPKPYPSRNWEKGMPFSECIASIYRHLLKYMVGSQEEDHIAAILFGAQTIAHYEHEIAAGRMDPALDDMPKYEQPKPGDRRGSNEVYVKHVAAAAKAATEIAKVMTPIRVEPPFCCPQCGGNLIGKPAGCTSCEYTKDDKQKPTVYVCGPITGRKDGNFPAFDRAKRYLEERGFNVISPADLDRAEGINPVGKDWDTFVADLRVKRPRLAFEVFKRDTEAILSLHPEHGDGLALLHDWPKSDGAHAEIWLGIVLGLHFYTVYGDLIPEKEIRGQL